MTYKQMPGIELNTWTTVSALNIHNFVAIKQFTSNNQINHSYAFLHNPDPINVRYENSSTAPYKNIFPGLVAIDYNNQQELDKFIATQKLLRQIK